MVYNDRANSLMMRCGSCDLRKTYEPLQRAPIIDYGAGYDDDVALSDEQVGGEVNAASIINRISCPQRHQTMITSVRD
jgi:hypothetical protein